ncbi:MAG: 23S rRNA pseudouridine(1911/1915/1917) synthase RluD [Porticoccaceae bacterium]|nr:23S rRNA pseudouridine(1911/1915/1917) synthase RluD [Porticoccaceae bacterium]
MAGERIEQQAVVPSSDIGRRFDQVAADLFSDFSRSRLQQWIKQGDLLVNSQRQVPKYKLLGGEILDLNTELAAEGDWQAEDIPLNIVFEDDAILVINKSANFVVHPAAGNYSGTVLNALLHHCPSLVSVPRAGIVHRLDKDTTGLMVVAKTLQAHTHLVAQLQARTVRREYEAVVTGVVIAGGTVDQPVGRHAKQRTKMAVISDGKEARTHFKVLDRFDGHSHLRLKLETGRTHQIRVHMAHIKYPIVGDDVYAGRLRLHKGASEELQDCIKTFGRQALHAKELELLHPTTGELIGWSSELPEDMLNLLEALAYG